MLRDMDDEARALLKGQIEAIWGEGRVELVDQLYAPQVVDRMPIPGQPSGREALKDVVRLFRTAMPDLRMDLHGTLSARGADGAVHAVDWWTLTGTHAGPLGPLAATAAAVEFGGIDWVRIDGGRIVELWHVEDMATFEAQVGAPDAGPPLPAPAIEHPPEPWTPDPAWLTPAERDLLAAAVAWFGSAAARHPPGAVLHAALAYGDHAALRWAVVEQVAGRRAAWHGLEVLRRAAGDTLILVQRTEEQAQRRAQLR